MNRIKALREILELSQEEMASLLNIKQPTLSNYENNIRNPSVKVCYKLISIAKMKDIDITLDYLRPT